jgi:hypothetical protein
VSEPVLVRQTGHALLSAASTSALIVGFPILLRLTSSDAEYAASAPLILAVSITRAPIMLPLQAFQGVLISSFLKNRDRRIRPLLLPTVGVCLLGMIAAALAYGAGRYVMALFGTSYHIEPAALAALTLDAALLAVLTLSGTALLASGRHRWYSAGWVTATCVSVALLFVHMPIGHRAIISLAVGPLCGVAVHWVAIATGAPPRPSGPVDGPSA